jgi:FeS assembly SUF system regulator
LAAAEGPHAARDLAVQTQIPEPTASKVLKKLARARVVVSQRGAKGGYALARPAEQIGVNEVIEAIEGPIAVTECSDDTTDSFCEYETNCGVRANWQRINVAVHKALSEITLADLRFIRRFPRSRWRTWRSLARRSSYRSRARAKRPSECARPARRAMTSTELE